MNRILSSIAAGIACLALALTPTIAAADNLSITNFQPAILHYAHADATGGYTNATTTPSDIPGATVTVPLTKRPLVGNSSGGAAAVVQFYKVCYTADVTKATATSGSINLVVNAATVTNAQRTSAVIGKNSLNGCWVGARPVATSFVIKLQGVSADSNTFTVTTAEMTVEVFYVS